MSDDFTRGFLEGVEVAARIFRNLVESEAARDNDEGGL